MVSLEKKPCSISIVHQQGQTLHVSSFYETVAYSTSVLSLEN